RLRALRLVTISPQPRRAVWLLYLSRKALLTRRHHENGENPVDRSRDAAWRNGRHECAGRRLASRRTCACRRIHRRATFLFTVVLPLFLLPGAVLLSAGRLSGLPERADDLRRAGPAGSRAGPARRQLLVLLPGRQGLLSIRQSVCRRLAAGFAATSVV